jgi:type II secretory pathway component PulK
MARSPRGSRRRRRGFVIVIVTVVIMLVALAAYGFLSLMEVENRAAFVRGDQLQAEAVAFSGREYLAAVLEQSRAERPRGAEQDDLADVFGNVLVDGDRQSHDEHERQGRFSVLAHATTEMAARNWRFGYENESAKLHLGTLLEWDRKQPGAGRAALMNLAHLDESTADAILDWIDPDDRARDQGAEAGYYLGRTRSCRPRNALPATLDELLLVRGVTRETLFGPDRDASFGTEAGETDSGDAGGFAAGGEGSLPLCRCLTVYSGERDETYEGRPRIRLNQADLGALHRELAAALEPTWANFIVAYRQYGPYAGSEAAGDPASLPLDLAKPPQRSIQSPLELIGVRIAIPTGEKDKKKIFASPFTDDPARMRDYLPKLMDQVTVRSGVPIIGRVNVNLAPREVLATIPGFDGALAERIISARTLVAADDPARHHAVWLLTEGIVDRQHMQRIEPWVTAGGDVGRAQIVGYYDVRSPYMRFETVVDGTLRPARQVYYKDLRRLGRGMLGDVIDVTETP